MNSFKLLCTMFCALALTVAVSSSAIAEDATGIMMVVKGDIKVTSKDGKTEAAKVGKKVSQGDAITAGADARAKIVMSDKNVINVSPDSKIVIEKYENAGDKKNVELNVVYGKVRAAVEQKYDGEKSKFNIKTPSAVAGVRGTDFMMGYNAGTKVSQVVTFSGSVAVGTPGPGGSIRNPVFVQPGQMTEAGSGGASKPKAVPKDDLNKMNSDSAGPDASAAKSDEPKTQAETKEEKKEEKKEEGKKDEGKKETAKSDEPKKDDGKKADSGPAAPADGAKSDRAPASDSGSTTPTSNSPPPAAGGAPPPPPPPPPDLGGRGPNGGPVMITVPTMPPTIPTLPVQQPTNTKSKATIILQPN